MHESVTKQIHSNVILTLCDIVPSETGASQSLCWRGSSGWEPAPQMSAVLQHSHPTHSSLGGPNLPQVSHHTDCCTLIWQRRTDHHQFTFFIFVMLHVRVYIMNQKASSYFFNIPYFTVLCCHWTLRFPKALLLCQSFTLKTWQNFCFLLCSKFSLLVLRICHVLIKLICFDDNLRRLYCMNVYYCICIFNTQKANTGT